jgi:hypothetical protein
MTITSLAHEGPPDKPKPVPLYSLVAAAKRLNSKNIKRLGVGKPDAWQQDAWDMFDLVGEQRFLATTMANRLAQARFFVGERPDDTTEEVEPMDDGPAYDAGTTLISAANFQQMVARLGLNLFMPGDGYLLGTPPDAVEAEDAAAAALGIRPEGLDDDVDPLAGIDLTTLKWQMLSTEELSVDTAGTGITVETDDGKKEYHADNVILIRVWRPHPKKWWKADSPTRSSLPVLRELVGLTMHISAQVDSRLAGAGVLLVPASAEAAMRAALGTEVTDELSPFAEALMDAMLKPIEDRSNASAVVPLIVSVPDESIDKFRHMSFAGPLDAEARNLRDEAIRRHALGQDCPPELLLGVGGMNHWGAWLVREDVVGTHLEPVLALICDAITTQFLHPVLEMQGVEDFQKYVIWYDVDHLILRPQRGEDAKWASEQGLISDAASRDALGFDESDAPKVAPNDPIKELVLEMLRTAPSLAQNPGLPVLADQIRAMLAGEVIPVPAPGTDPTAPVEAPQPAEEPTTEGGVPATSEDAPTEPTP